MSAEPPRPRMSPEGTRDKPWYLQLPAKLGAVVVFLVAVTTLIGNVLDLNQKRHAPETDAPARPSVQAPVAAPAVAAAAPASRRVELAVDRIAVEQDGSPGTTDWRFTIEAAGEPLLAFRQDDLDDTAGRDIAMPRDVGARLRLDGAQSVPIVIRGWRGSRFRLPGSEPDAEGQGVLAPSGVVAPIRVAAGDARRGAFVFYLSTDAR